MNIVFLYFLLHANYVNPHYKFEKLIDLDMFSIFN
jgi:hypothetical protein